jgi:hypothetical protein
MKTFSLKTLFSVLYLTSYHPFHNTIYNIKTKNFPQIKRTKFASFTEKYIREYAKPLKKSYKCDLSRLKNLMHYFGDLCIDEISSYHLVEYRKQRMQEKGAKRKTFVAPSTINRELGI